MLIANNLKMESLARAKKKVYIRSSRLLNEIMYMYERRAFIEITQW